MRNEHGKVFHEQQSTRVSSQIGVSCRQEPLLRAADVRFAARVWQCRIGGAKRPHATRFHRRRKPRRAESRRVSEDARPGRHRRVMRRRFAVIWQKRRATRRSGDETQVRRHIGDYRKLLENKDIDAVVITHARPLARLHDDRRLPAGKDVYCEKPLTLTIAEGQAMVAAASDTSESCRPAASSGPTTASAWRASWSDRAGSARCRRCASGFPA